MRTTNGSRWKKIPVFGRFDGSELVRFFDITVLPPFLSPTLRSLGETASIRLRLINMDSSDDLPGFIPDFEFEPN